MRNAKRAHTHSNVYCFNAEEYDIRRQSTHFLLQSHQLGKDVCSFCICINLMCFYDSVNLLKCIQHFGCSKEASDRQRHAIHTTHCVGKYVDIKREISKWGKIRWKIKTKCVDRKHDFCVLTPAFPLRYSAGTHARNKHKNILILLTNNVMFRVNECWTCETY